jgi:hypothetical protein
MVTHLKFTLVLSLGKTRNKFVISHPPTQVGAVFTAVFFPSAYRRRLLSASVSDTCLHLMSLSEPVTASHLAIEA